MSTRRRTENPKSLPDLPQELIDEILSRLPVKSIRRFMCVSKQWQASLVTPQFAKSHLNNSNTDFSSGGLMRNIGWENIYFDVGGSCNGLILLVARDDTFLMNPITLEYEKVIDDSHCDRFKVYGLGYHHSKDDYQIVTLNGKSVDIYSFKTKTWRSIPRLCRGLRYSIPSAGVFVDECINWLAEDDDDDDDEYCVISTFNLAREEFDEVQTPPEIQRINIRNINVFRGCLAVIDIGYETIDVWVMKMYGVRDSWTKLAFHRPEWFHLVDVVFPLNDYEIFLKEGKAFFVCDSRNGDCKTLVNNGVQPNISTGSDKCAFTIRGSLVSPKYE